MHYDLHLLLQHGLDEFSALGQLQVVLVTQHEDVGVVGLHCLVCQQRVQVPEAQAKLHYKEDANTCSSD